MGTMDKLVLRWNDFESNYNSSFSELRTDSEFFDVTLACSDDREIKAHKIILAACSPFFRRILNFHHHEHPLLYLKNISYLDMEAILDFMYMGQVSISQDTLAEFLSVAKDLKVKGLCNSTDLASQYFPNVTDSQDSLPAKRLCLSDTYTDMRLDTSITPLSYIKSKSSFCGSNPKKRTITPNVSDYVSTMDNELMVDICLDNDNVDLKIETNEDFNETIDGYSTNVYQDGNTDNKSEANFSPVEMATNDNKVCGPSRSPDCVIINTFFEDEYSSQTTGGIKDKASQNIAMELDAYFRKHSVRHETGTYLCLQCGRSSRDWSNNRRHLTVHIFGNPSDDDENNLKNRIDAYIDKHTERQPLERGYNCFKCSKLLRICVANLRKHFIVRHLYCGRSKIRDT